MHRVTEYNHRKKKRIIYIMGEKCCLCGYNKCHAALEMHHIDKSEKEFSFSRSNHYFSIVEMEEEMKKCVLVCSNCHKEIHYGDKGNIKLTSSFDETRFNEIVKKIEEVKAVIVSKPKNCLNCGQLIHYRAVLCTKCHAEKLQRVQRPSRDELKELIRKESFEQIGKTYEVSGKAVVKWCISYNLPSRKIDINAISDNDWLLI